MSEYIEIKNVSKSFGKKKVLENVSIEIPQGRTVGIVGKNGSGKSVLMKLLCGFEKPNKGKIVINGADIGRSDRYPENIGVFINSPGFVSFYTGFQNLKYLADIQGRINDEKICSTMEMVGLDPSDRTKVKNYSLGMKQKLGIAQAIMEDQELIILDEPFNALDFRTYEEIKHIIRELKADGRTILLISHNFEDIEELCDDVYMIENRNLCPCCGTKKNRGAL